MTKKIALALALVLGLGLAGCGDDDPQDAPTATTAATTTTTDAGPATSIATSQDAVALWPAADVTFTTPEAAAKDFVAKVLDVPPTLGPFQQGDSRSGEIEVFSPGEGGGTKVKRATLVLRRLGTSNGWFVIAAGSNGVSIANLSTGDEVTPGKVTVQGQGRGFEGTLVVTGYVRGDDVELGKVVTQGGSMADKEAYSAALDLAGATRGSTVFVVVRGGTGLETDPGEFAAVALRVK